MWIYSIISPPRVRSCLLSSHSKHLSYRNKIIGNRFISILKKPSFMRLVLYPRLRQTLDMLEDFLFIFSHTKHDIIIIILLKNCISERKGRNPEEMKRERTIKKHDAKCFATNYSSGFLGLYFSIL